MAGEPAWMPMLDLNNTLELGPNCPPDDIAPDCDHCPERAENGCVYALSPGEKKEADDSYADIARRNATP